MLYLKKSLFLWLIIASCLLMRCGFMEKSQSKKLDQTPEWMLPEGWSGLADWEGSLFEVQDDL